MKKLTTLGLPLFMILMLLFSGSLLAQNFKSSSASAKLTDRDNNGYANIGDLVHLQIIADNVPDDSTNAAVIMTYYNSVDTLYLTKAGGTGPGFTGNSVVFTNVGGSAIAERPVGTGFNAKKASFATTPSDGILRFILYKRLQVGAGAGPKQILDLQTSILIGDGTSPVAFRDTIDNERPQTSSTKSVLMTTSVGNANVANIGDQLKYTISEAGTGGTLSKVALLFFAGANQIQPLVDIDPSVLATSNVTLGNPFDGSVQTASAGNGFINMVKNGANWEATVTLKAGQIDQVANSTTGAYVYVVDQFGNVGSFISIDNLTNAIDNKISDLFVVGAGSDTTTTANAVQDTLTDLTTDGISGAYIIGSKVGFKYTEPAGNQNKILTVSMDLSLFGGSSSVPLTYGYTNGGFRVFKTPIQTFTQTTTDAVMNTLRPRITITDSAGNVLNTYAKINVATKVDLAPPGSFSVVLGLTTETANANGTGNPGETITASFSGLNQDVQGYRLLANNNHVNTGFTAQQRDLLTGTFSTAGNIDGGGLIVPSATGTTARAFTLSTYTPTSVPSGLRITANDASGTITFIVRDDAGNEGTATAAMPFPVTNINPVQPTNALVTLQYDGDGNNKANIGDSLKVTISGSGADANLQNVYVFFPSKSYGAVGQQAYTSIDVNNFSTQGINNDGNTRPDWIRLTKVGGNFVTTIPVINDPNSEFTGMTGAAGTLTLSYYVVDNSGNPAGTYTTSALTQSFDNQIPTSATINTNVGMTATNANAAAGFTTTYINVGSTVTLTYNNAPADIDTVWADLRIFGLTANEALLKSTLGVVGNAQKIFTVTAYAGTGVADVPSGIDSARIPITVRDRSSNVSTLATATVNSISTTAGTTILAIDRISPVAIGQAKVTLIHTDLINNGVPKPSDNNGIINVGERVRILFDVSNQPDFATLGSITVDLSAFGLGVQTINANTAAPAPGSSGYGYDAMGNVFVADQAVANGGYELAAGSVAITIRNVVDNGGNQTDPTNNPASYTGITVARRIDALNPVITIPANSFAFSSSTDVNGDGIAGIGDGVQISADVVGADSVFADLRPIGRGITPMPKGVGNNYVIPTITVLASTDQQWASDDKIGNTTITIIAQDVVGNRSTATTVALAVDNTITNPPQFSLSPIAAGRFTLTIVDGQSAAIQNTTLAFGTDMTGGTVAGTSRYQVFYDSTGTGIYTSAGSVSYAGATTTFTSIAFNEGRAVSFKVTPFDHSGNQGVQSLPASGVARTTPSPALTYEPTNQSIIGTTTVSIRVQIDTTKMGLVNAITFRTRPVDIDPGTSGNQPGNWFTLGASTQTGDVWSRGVVGTDFTGTVAVGYYYEVIALVTDKAGNVQTDAQALAANGSLFIFADGLAPTVQMIAINDSTFGGIEVPPPFVDVKARGNTRFKYTITDNLPLSTNTSRIQVQLNIGAGLFTVISSQTVADLIAAGYLSVSGSTYTVQLDMTGYVGLNPTIALTFNDGRGNTTTYSQQFSVDDKVAPAFYMREPFPSTAFRNSLRVVLTATGVGNSTTMSEAQIQISTTANFASPILVGTVTTAALTTLAIPNTLTLTDGATYYVRAVIKDALGNQFITDVNPVLYLASLPTLTVTYPQAITVSGVQRITTTSKIVATPSNSNVASIAVRTRRIDQDASNFTATGFVSSTVSQAPFEFSLNTTTNYTGYEGYIVFEFTVTDAAGTSFPPQYFTAFVDNKGPSFRIMSVNGSTQLSSFPTILSGSTLSVQVDVLENDVASGQFMISNFNTGAATVTVMGVAQRVDKSFIVNFPLPASSVNNVVNMDPLAGLPRISADFRDSVGNQGTYVGPSSGGTPNMGAITVLGIQQPTAYFANIQRGFRLRGNFIAWVKTTGMSNVGGSVRFELKRPNASAFEVIGTDVTEPYQVTYGSTNYTDGSYVLRAVPISANNIEYAADTMTVMFDNTNDGTTGRATIVSLGGARIGGTSITFRANSGSDVGNVLFQGRFITGFNGSGGTNTGWKTLGTGNVRKADGTFTLSFTAAELAAAYGVSIANLDGEHEFRAISEDQVGYQYFILNNPGTSVVPFGTGNQDDVLKVATTRAIVDVTAPNGTVVVNDSPITTKLWGSQTFQTYNLFDASATLKAVVNDASDFGVAEVTLQRWAAKDPGTGYVTANQYGYNEGQERVVASYASAAGINYTIDPTTMARGGVYEIKIKLRDNLGNERTIEDFFFVARKPQAYVSGYNQEHKWLYITTQNHAQSVKLEFSTDNGVTYKEISINDLTTVASSSNLDNYKTHKQNLQNINLPAGPILFRLTASDAAQATFAQGRFASAPSYFRMTVGANGSWTPTNLATSGIVLQLNKPQGAISNVLIEAQPENSSDRLAIMTIMDNNPGVSTNTLTENWYPREMSSTANANVVLQTVDGVRLGLINQANNPPTMVPLTTTITNGGLFQVFASNVRSNDEVDLTLQTISVQRIMAAAGGSATSASGNFTITMAANALTSNAGIYIEEDAAKFRSYLANQLEMGQIGNAYWLAGFNSSMRSGFRASVTIKFQQSDVVDANKDGTIDGKDKLMLNVATISGNAFNFSGDIKDKVVDTVNNTVVFTISSISSVDRFALVLDNALSVQQGSILVADLRVGNVRSNNFTTFAAASFQAFVGDNGSGVNTSTAMLFVDGLRVQLTANTVVSTNSIRFNSSFSGLNLVEGRHSGRFVVENNNGNRYDKTFTFYIDQSTPHVIQQSALFGRNKNQAISFYLTDPANALKPGSGIDTLTVFVDVYGTKAVKKDSSELAYEIQQFIGRLNPSQLSFSNRLDSCKVTFTMVDNLASANLNGYELVVHDGTTSLSLILNSNIGNGTNTLLNYGSRGVWDLAGNEAFPMNFRVTQDATPPTISLLGKQTHGTTLVMSVLDSQSGVDTASIVMMEVDADTKDTTVSTIASIDKLTYLNDVLTYTANSIGNTLLLTVSDQFANVTTFKFFAESDSMAIRDFHAYPNPFNPELRDASVTFLLSRSARVSIEAFDWLGRSAGMVTESQSFSPGRPLDLKFSGRQSNGTPLANGVYFLKMTANDGTNQTTSIFKVVVAVKR